MSTKTYTAGMAETRIKNIPEMLWRQFKAICVLEGLRVNDQLIELVKQYVDEKGKQN